MVSGDTFTLTFDRGTPAFDLHSQPSSQFASDPSGLPVKLAGSAGLRVALRDFRGDMSNYTGPKSMSASGKMLLQVAEIGSFEGVVTWALGLSEPGCAVLETGASTLSFHIVPERAAPITTADAVAVAKRVFREPYPMGCQTGDTGCPITSRLGARIFQSHAPNPTGPGPADTFCRCQNPGGTTMTATGELTPPGAVAHVVLYPDSPRPIKLDLLMVMPAGRLLVDDMWCTGQGASSSVYAPQPTACG